MSFKGDVNQIPAREGAILVNFQSRDLNLGYQSQSVTVHSGSCKTQDILDLLAKERECGILYSISILSGESKLQII